MLRLMKLESRIVLDGAAVAAVIDHHIDDPNDTVTGDPIHHEQNNDQTHVESAAALLSTPDSDSDGDADSDYDTYENELTAVDNLTAPAPPEGADNQIRIDEDTSYVLTVDDFGFSDSDGDTLDKVRITSLETAGSLQLNGVDVQLNQEITVQQIMNGELTFTPNQDANGDNYASFRFQVHDGTDYSAYSYTMGFDVTPIQDAPVAADTTVVTNEDTHYEFTLADFSFIDVDDGDSFDKIQVTSLETHGTLLLDGVEVALNQEISAADIAAGKLTFTPAPNANGPGYSTFQFKVHDGHEFSVDSYNLTVDVQPVNDLPSGTDKPITIDEDTSYTFNAEDFGFSDVDAGDSLQSIQITKLEQAGTLTLDGVQVSLGDTISVEAIDAGLLVFTPAADANGEAYSGFRFKVNDGKAYSADSNAIAIDVNAVNDAPTAADQTVTAKIGVDYHFSSEDFGFSDVDTGDTLDKIQIVSLETPGSIQLNGADIQAGDEIDISDIPNLVFVTADPPNPTSFEYKVSDGEAYSVDTYTMNVDITSGPTADDSSVQMDEDTVYVFSESDFNFDDQDGDTLAMVQITSLETAGKLQLNGVDIGLNQQIGIEDIKAGLLTFTPNQDANGEGYSEFTFKVGDGTETSVFSYKMTVNVDPVQDAPTGMDNTVTAYEDEVYTFKVSDFGYNDVDGEPMDKVLITRSDTPGTLMLNGNEVGIGETIEVAASDIDAGLLTFVGEKDQFGENYANLSFQVNDGIEYSADTNILTIDVESVPDIPIGEPNEITMDEDGTYTFKVDDFAVGDVDGNDLTMIRITRLESAGELKLNGVDVVQLQEISIADIEAGLLTYTPNADAYSEIKTMEGTDNPLNPYADFQFRVKTNKYSAESNTMEIVVFGTPDAPEGKDSEIPLNEGDDYVIKFSDFGFTDKDGDNPLSVTITDINLAAGKLKLNGSDVQPGDVISVGDILAGKLTYEVTDPDANSANTPVNDFNFVVRDDSGVAGLDTSEVYTMSMDHAALNDAPVLHGVPTETQEISSTEKLVISGISISDVDIARGEGDGTVEVTLTVSDGVISLGSTNGITFTSGGNGTSQMTFHGSLADVNKAMGTLSYHSNAGFSGEDVLHIDVNDRGNFGAPGPLNAIGNSEMTIYVLGPHPKPPYEPPPGPGEGEFEGIPRPYTEPLGGPGYGAVDFPGMIQDIEGVGNPITGVRSMAGREIWQLCSLEQALKLGCRFANTTNPEAKFSAIDWDELGWTRPFLDEEHDLFSRLFTREQGDPGFNVTAGTLSSGLPSLEEAVMSGSEVFRSSNEPTFNEIQPTELYAATGWGVKA